MSLVGRFEHLPNRPRSDEARPLLEKIASQVKPIMAKRGWKVGTLAEFLPSNPALLGNNMNAGQRINLRLRPPGATSTFYEYDQLVLVMLHELTHNEHGPHNAQFYKLLGELEEEYWELKRKGYSGEGFHGAGSHLPGLKLNEYEGRKKGMEAAQKRLDTQRKIGKGGVLGGAGTGGRGMKEVLAEAAERRIRDDKACHTDNEGHDREVEDEVRKAQEESVGVDAEDLALAEPNRTDAAPPVATEPNVNKPVAPTISLPVPKMGRLDPAARLKIAAIPPRIKSTSTPDPKKQSTVFPHDHNPKSTVQDPSPASSPSPFLATGEWSCPTCTLINSATALQCDACTTPRPRVISTQLNGDVWYCEFCGAGPREMSFWSCGECGWVRNYG